MKPLDARIIRNSALQLQDVDLDHNFQNKRNRLKQRRMELIDSYNQHVSQLQFEHEKSSKQGGIRSSFNAMEKATNYTQTNTLISPRSSQSSMSKSSRVMSAQRNQKQNAYGSSMMISHDSTPIMENRRAGLLNKRQIKGAKNHNDATPIIDIQTTMVCNNQNDKVRPLTGRPSYFQNLKSPQGQTPKSSITRVFSANHLSPKQNHQQNVAKTSTVVSPVVLNPISSTHSLFSLQQNLHKPFNQAQNASQIQRVVTPAKPQIARSIASARNSLRDSQNLLLLSPKMAPTGTSSAAKRPISHSPKPSPLRSSHLVLSHQQPLYQMQVNKQSKRLTKMTHDRNAETLTQLSKYDEIQSAQNGKSSRGELTHQKSASELLNNATHDIKLITYRLARIVPTESIHILVNLNQLREVECLPGETQQVKINFKGLNESLIVMIKKKVDKRVQANASKFQPQISYKAYTSVTVRMPNEHNCDRIILNKRQFIFDPKTQPPPPDKNQVRDQLFMTFISDMGCTLQIQAMSLRSYESQKNASLTQTDQVVAVKKTNKILTKGQPKADPSIIERQLKQFVDKYELEHPKPQEVDHISGNRQTQWKFNELRTTRLIHQSLHLPAKVEEVIERKQIQNEHDTKRKYFGLYKWDILKAKRKEFYDDLMLIKQQKRRVKLYIATMFVRRVARELQVQNETRKNALYYAIQQYKSATRLQFRTKKALRKHGRTQEIRYVKQIRNSLSFLHIVNVIPVEDEARPVIKEFLEETQSINEMKQCFLNYYRKIAKIQKANQTRIKSKKARLMILNDYWEQCKTEATIALGQVKKPKSLAAKTQKLSLKLLQIPVEVKEKYFQMYFNFCKEVYLIKFLHWRNTKVRARGESEVSVEWENEIPRIFYSLKKVQKTLFENLNSFANEQLIDNNLIPYLEQIEQTTSAKIIRDIVCQAEQNIMKAYAKNSEQQERPQDPGASPLFLFMPKKIQIVKMLINAAYYSDISNEREEEQE